MIKIRPFKGGWQCYEAPGVQPYWTGDRTKEDAIGYATARMKFGGGEIRVLGEAGEVERVISFAILCDDSTTRRGGPQRPEL